MREAIMSVRLCVTYIFFVCIFSSFIAEKTVAEPTETAAPDPIKLMTYNLENLFDEYHDEGKLDYTFTPKGTAGKDEYCKSIRHSKYKQECSVSWTLTRVRDKISRLVRVIKNGKTGKKSIPDILVVSEIENPSIAERFNDKLGMGEFVMTDSPDARGIDLAVFYNPSKDLKFIEKKEIKVNLTRLRKETKIHYKATRNILEVKFEIYGKYTLFLYALHFPSQSAPGKV